MAGQDAQATEDWVSVGAEEQVRSKRQGWCSKERESMGR